MKKSMVVSVCIIAFNEEEYLLNLLDDILAQDYPHRLMEIILVNSASTDSTLSIMKNFKKDDYRFKRICILENTKKIQAAGWNIAIKASQGDTIVRIDAHSKIPPDFISKNVLCLEQGENISGGARPCIIKNNSAVWEKVLLMAEKSMFGSGMADYRNGAEKKYVKSMFHATYKKDVFEKVGYFNEKLGRTEDNDIHYRMRAAGYRFCYNPNIISYQYARPNLQKMLRQKFSNGYWIGLTMAIQPKCFSWYHFVPCVFVLALIMSIILEIGYEIVYPLVFLMALYGAFSLIMSVVAIKKERFSIIMVLLPIIFGSLHISYGVGTIVGLCYLPIWKLTVDS